ncbi:HD-GYP domain-containing protein [Chitinimonas viridis]|uniref:HD-GYP domain-containing protein n=1 Tax=Chitinimonas viridis TaxID=664880 RepID=A0ABT8B593_9NEIS|nr:HD-GYP domain-containing protein [Chitinimonas viridis]MDN3577170.1 HD-GYP domain-containing protein [Chitinimonas viridis]
MSNPPFDVHQTPHNQGLLRSLMLMAWMVEARDPYTGGHLWRVARMAEELGRSLGMPDKEVHRIALAGFLHDIGKIGVPDAVLRKPGKLDDDEYAVIKAHPAIGQRILAEHPLAHLVMDVVFHHHETPDGRGYPVGLVGTAIPLDARLVGICDAFDAMTSTRPYRKGMPIAAALEIISSAAGRQFDAELASRFVALGREGAFDHIVGHTDEGIPLGVCASCGPVIQRYRATQPGEHADCPACNARYEWQQTGSGLHAAHVGKTHGNLSLPLPDTSLLQTLLSEWAPLLT